MKYRLILLVLAGICRMTQLQAQSLKKDVLVVNAKIAGQPAGQWLYYGSTADFKTKKDSALTVAGGFRIEIPIKKGQADQYTFQFGSNGYLPNAKAALYVEPGELNIVSDGPEFHEPKFSGSMFVTDFNDYNAYVNHPPDSLLKRYPGMGIVNLLLQRAKVWVKAHPSSPAGFAVLADFCNQLKLAGVDLLDSLGTCYNYLTPQAKDNLMAKRVAEDMQLMSGRPAPDFAEPDVSGKMVSLKDFRGKYVLVDFWASWCAPCRAENPNVITAYNKYKTRGFDVLGVSWDTQADKPKWLAAIRYDRLPFTEVSDLQGRNNVAGKLYRVTEIPTNFLIGPDGIIIARNLRGEELQKKLDEVLPK